MSDIISLEIGTTLFGSLGLCIEGSHGKYLEIIVLKIQRRLNELVGKDLHLTVTSEVTCVSLLTSPKPHSDKRSGQGLNGCVGSRKAPKMVHCSGAIGVEATRRGGKHGET